VVKGYWNAATVGKTNGDFAGSVDGSKFFLLEKKRGKVRICRHFQSSS
jgi:hypothetical protein